MSIFERGYQYLSEVRLDSVAGTLEALRDGLDGVGLLPRSMEDEWGPGQMEFSFSPISGLAAADAVVLFRSAVKQMCQRRGLLATFMCRPALPNFFSSGWHLHESLISREDGQNVFASEDEALSATGRHFVAGLLEHALPMTVFATPTVNGYKRFRPYSFAPDRVCWAVENRGALIRVQGAPGDSNSHVENRMGEPAANPYLYMAANLAAGLDGMRRKLEPPPPVEADPYAAEAPMLPTSLSQAVGALVEDQFFRSAFGDVLVDYLVQMKRAELARYEAAIARQPAARRPGRQRLGDAGVLRVLLTQPKGGHDDGAAHRLVQFPARAQRGRGRAVARHGGVLAGQDRPDVQVPPRHRPHRGTDPGVLVPAVHRVPRRADA